MNFQWYSKTGHSLTQPLRWVFFWAFPKYSPYRAEIPYLRGVRFLKGYRRKPKVAGIPMDQGTT